MHAVSALRQYADLAILVKKFEIDTITDIMP
jgi:hypothetical protein